MKTFAFTVSPSAKKFQQVSDRLTHDMAPIIFRYDLLPRVFLPHIETLGSYPQLAQHAPGRESRESCNLNQRQIYRPVDARFSQDCRAATSRRRRRTGVSIFPGRASYTTETMSTDFSAG